MKNEKHIKLTTTTRLKGLTIYRRGRYIAQEMTNIKNIAIHMSSIIVLGVYENVFLSRNARPVPIPEHNSIK